MTDSVKNSPQQKRDVKKKIRSHLSRDEIMRQAVAIVWLLITERELSQTDAKSVLAKALSLLS